MKIEVMLFLPPNGNQRRMSYDIIDDSLSDKYKDMQKYECQLEMELLSTGVISITVSDLDKDLDIILVENHQKSIKIGIETLLKRAVWTDKKLETSNDCI